MDERLNEYECGGLDLRTASVATLLEVALMRMLEKRETHLETAIPHGGGIYWVHFCLDQVLPPEDPILLTGRKQ